MNKILIAISALIVLGGAYYYWDTNMRSAETEGGASNVSGMRAEDNAVVATDQKPGNELTIAQVYLEKEGYVVIHEESGGAAGAILGSSALLGAGENSNVSVMLNRASRDGETLYAMLHSEMGGNATFSPAEDTPVESILGGPLMGSFMISTDASAQTPVTI